jgi:hypothetical protein
MGVKNFAIGLAITIILPCVTHYGVLTFSPAAKYYSCSKQQYLESAGMKKAGDPGYDKARVAALETEYNTGREAFNRHLFYIAVPTGILAIAAGLLMPVPGIGAGFMFGGLLTLLYGFFINWPDLPVGVRFISLLFGLVLFIVIGWTKYTKKPA